MHDVFPIEPEVFNEGIYGTEAVTYGFSMRIVLVSLPVLQFFWYGFDVFEPRFCIHVGPIGAFLGLLVEGACFQVYYM